MNKEVGRILAKSLVLSACVLFLVASTGYCNADTGGTKDWDVPMFGVFKVPQAFHAAEFKELKALTELQKAEIPADKVAALGPGNPLDKVEFTVFQLTMNDGQVYRQAWLLVVKDKQPIAQVNEFFSFVSNPEERVKAILMQDSFSRDVAKLSYKDPKTGVGVKVLEIAPLEFVSIAGNPAAGGSVRIMAEYGDLLFPVYGQGYVFAVKGHLSGVLLIAGDGDSPFWRTAIGPIVQSLETREK
jgi:hypothetical protein